MMKNPYGTPDRPMYLIPTYSGKIVNVDTPRKDDIELIDIAHALSRICRWGAQGEWISVAAHSIAMARYAMKSKIFEKKDALECLLHDAAEAYLGDTIGPVRRCLVAQEQRSVTGESSLSSTLECLHETMNFAIGNAFGLSGHETHYYDRSWETGHVSFARGAVVVSLDQLAFKAEIVLGWGRKIWDMPPMTPELESMVSCVKRAMDIEDDGSPAGRTAIKCAFLRLFDELKAAS
jgi:hypothetical protein